MERAYEANRRLHWHAEGCATHSQAKSSIGETSALNESKQDFGRLLQEFERINEILERFEKDIQ